MQNPLSAATSRVKLAQEGPCELHLDRKLILLKGTINLQVVENYVV